MMEELSGNGRRLYDVMKRIKRQGIITHSLHDLRPSELMMLHGIVRLNNTNKKAHGVTVSELSCFMCQTPSAVSQTVKALEGKGYISRSADPSDRRIWYVSLCPNAYKIIHEAENAFSKELNRLVLAMGEKDAEQLISLLDKLAVALEAIRKPEPETQTQTPETR